MMVSCMRLKREAKASTNAAIAASPCSASTHAVSITRSSNTMERLAARCSASRATIDSV